MTNVFFDFSATNSGDGTTAAQAGSPGGVGAFNTIVGQTISANNTWWIRRVTNTNTITLSASVTFSVDGIKLIGWPISTDVDYAGRPASGTSNGWDSDSAANLPTIVTTTTGVQFITSTTNINQAFRRIKFFQNSATTVAAVLVQNSAEFRYCTFTSLCATAGIRTVSIGSLGIGTGATFYNCTLDGQGTQGALQTAASTNPQFFDCAFTKTVTSQAAAATSSNTFASGLFVRCTFTDAISTPMRDFVIIASSVATSPVVMLDCTITANGLASSTVTSGTWNFNISSSAIIKNMNFTGAAGVSVLTTTPGTFVHLSNLTQTRSGNTTGLSLAIICQIVIDNASFLGNTTSDIITLFGATIFLKNVQFGSPIQVTGPTNPGILSLDHNGVIGAWAYWGPHGRILTSAATRSGGTAFSIRMFMEDQTQPNFLPIEFNIPGIETNWVSISSGARTVTVYGAYKNYSTAPTQEDIWFEVDYYDLAAGAHTITTSTKTGLSTALTSDSSTWTGDTGLTVFKMVATFTAGQTGIFPVRIKMSKIAAGCYTLIDPTPVVT